MPVKINHPQLGPVEVKVGFEKGDLKLYIRKLNNGEEERIGSINDIADCAQLVELAETLKKLP